MSAIKKDKEVLVFEGFFLQVLYSLQKDLNLKSPREVINHAVTLLRQANEGHKKEQEICLIDKKFIDDSFKGKPIKIK